MRDSQKEDLLQHLVGCCSKCVPRCFILSILYSFEHSLVEELSYTGFERLRRGFDRAFGGEVPTFSVVVDAGCGTGLVGEQVRVP